METIDQSFGFLSDISLAIPLGQVFAFGILTSLCLVFGKHKIGLLIAYGFLFYWAFILNRVFFLKQLEETSGGVYIYGVLGVIMALMGFVGCIKKTE